jgi:hypothetical protein
MKSLVFFIVPKGTNSFLTEEGWYFSPTKPLPANVVTKVLKHFKVALVEEYLEIKKYQNEKTQINVNFNDGAACEISVRTRPYGVSLEGIRDLLGAEAVEIIDSKVANMN